MSVDDPRAATDRRTPGVTVRCADRADPDRARRDLDRRGKVARLHRGSSGGSGRNGCSAERSPRSGAAEGQGRELSAALGSGLLDVVDLPEDLQDEVVQSELQLLELHPDIGFLLSEACSRTAAPTFHPSAE